MAGSVLASDKPAYLVIDLGANDVINGHGGDSLVENLRSIVRAASSAVGAWSASSRRVPFCRIISRQADTASCSRRGSS